MFPVFLFFFLNDTAPTEIYTLSLHDALPISEHAVIVERRLPDRGGRLAVRPAPACDDEPVRDGHGARAGSRLGQRSEEHTSELHHANISYAVFCLKKKKTTGIYVHNRVVQTE